jgi:MFS family permease
MVVTLTATVASFLSMTYWGPLADRYGNYRILYITCIWIPTIAFAWIFFKNIYILIFLQLFAGFVWAGFGLATGNYIFDAVRRENIPIVWAYFNTFNNLFAFGGSILGGLTTKILPEKRVEFLRFAEHNYEIIFAVSAILRLVVVLLFAKRFKEVRNVEKSPNINFFYVYKPASNVINMFTIIVEKMKRIIK